MRKRLLLCTLAACTAAPPPSPSRPAPVALAPDAAAPAPIAVAVDAGPPPEPVGAWRTRPPEKADFYVALDGLCRYLRVDVADGEAFAITTSVPYIGPPDLTTIAHVSDDGLDALEGGGAVEHLTGHWPDAIFSEHWGGERMYIGSSITRWDGAAWKPLFDNPHDRDPTALRRAYQNPTAWKKGYVAVVHSMKPDESWQGHSPAIDFATVDVPVAEVKPLLKPGWTPEGVVGLPSGELFAVGQEKDHPVVRWLDGAGAVHEYTFPDAGNGALERVDGVRLVVGKKAVARFDGAGFVAIAPAPKIAPPEPGAEVVGGWAFTKKGSVWARENDAWVKKTLPPPAFGTSTSRSLSSFTVLPGGEVMFVVGYYEKGRGWKDPVLHHALVRSHRPRETFRCNEPDPEQLAVASGSGYASWPPLADEACTTPFVLLGRRSNAKPAAQKDWAGIRKALKGKSDVGASIDLVEVKAGDRTYVGAATKDLAAARTILDTVAKGTPTRGEILCAVPQATATFHVDVASGEIVN